MYLCHDESESTQSQISPQTTTRVQYLDFQGAASAQYPGDTPTNPDHSWQPEVKFLSLCTEYYSEEVTTEIQCIPVV